MLLMLSDDPLCCWIKEISYLIESIQIYMQIYTHVIKKWHRIVLLNCTIQGWFVLTTNSHCIEKLSISEGQTTVSHCICCPGVGMAPYVAADGCTLSATDWYLQPDLQLTCWQWVGEWTDLINSQSLCLSWVRGWNIHNLTECASC